MSHLFLIQYVETISSIIVSVQNKFCLKVTCRPSAAGYCWMHNLILVVLLFVRVKRRFQQVSVISRRCLLATESSMLTFIVQLVPFLTTLVCHGPGSILWPPVPRNGHYTGWATGAGYLMLGMYIYNTCHYNNFYFTLLYFYFYFQYFSFYFTLLYCWILLCLRFYPEF